MNAKMNSDAKKPIQPFVPVSPNESTELYSHKDLRALTNADARNELDEMSEPSRFKKDVSKPEAPSDSVPDLGVRPRRANNLLLAFLAGAAVAGVVVAFTTRKTGPQLRGDLKDLARRTKRKAGDRRRRLSDRPGDPRA